MQDEDFLPAEILAKAVSRHGEYAWRVADIPEVIQAAKASNLLSVGGQLQFHLPFGTCDCYWVSVDIGDALKNVPWQERINSAADIARDAYDRLRETRDFIAEGREGFPTEVSRFENEGGDLEEAMYFVWYVERQPH